MSGTRTMKHVTAPRHAMTVYRPTLRQRIQLSPAGRFATNAALVIVAVVLMFTAVLGLLAVTSWATDHHSGASTTGGY